MSSKTDTTSHFTKSHPAAPWSAKRISITALFVAAATITSYLSIPLFPAAPYLKYDPSGALCLIAGFAGGPSLGLYVSLLMWLPHFPVDPIGACMGAIAAVSMTVPAALVYQHHRTRSGAFAAMVAGAAICLAACIGANLLITPLYTALDTAGVAKLIWPVILPFNAVKIFLNCLICSAVYKNVSAVMGRLS